ncbi:hypothetical protein KC315_g5406 [Hortaea werneckii]|nr:hypothetical protein KC315_g5406 [Hortaea werneckii]
MHMSFRSGVPILTEPRQDRREQQRVGRKDMHGSGYPESFEELRYQADVSCPMKLGSLLVDEPEHHNNMQLWIELLHFRQRLDGLSGIVAIWKGMRQRNVDTPTEGSAAQILWSAFISTITVDRRLHPAAPSIPDLFAYAIELKARTGKFYADFYTIVVGRSFRVDAAMASNWHRRLTSAGLAPEKPLKLIVKDVVFGERIKRFQDMYKRSGERDLYDIAVGAALQWEAEQEAASQITPNLRRNDLTIGRALRWHRFLLRYGDGPSQEFFTRPEVQRLFELDGDESLPMIHAQSYQGAMLPESDQPSPSIDIQHYPSLTRANFSSFMGEAHGIKQKEVSDNFVAKMFATRAFPLDLVINGLTFFSVNKVGGVALRTTANEIWANEGDPGTPLFDIPSALLDDTNADPARLQDLLAAFFGRHAHVRYDKEEGLHEYVDIKAWSSAVAARQAHYPSANPQYDLGMNRIPKAKHRHLAWANSPLRVALGLRATKKGGRIEPDRNGTWLSRGGRERVEAQAAQYGTPLDEDD